jgi:protein-S-isoprenylcysteine O-methyltransferase Ste14
MSPLTLSRILFVLLIINEAYVITHTSSEEMKEINVPPLTAISAILLLAPWFFVLPLPDWLGWLAVALQVIGLILEISAETQLMRADSFAASSQAGKNVQTSGMYRWLENPIYVGIFLQGIGWMLWMPIGLITIVLLYLVVRQMVARERKHLLTLGISHRGLDSSLWT